MTMTPSIHCLLDNLFERGVNPSEGDFKRIKGIKVKYLGGPRCRPGVP